MRSPASWHPPGSATGITMDATMEETMDMHRTSTELQWYLRHEWERRLCRAEWTGDVPNERTSPARPRRGRGGEQP